MEQLKTTDAHDHPNREIRVHIDRKPLDSVNPTSGEALYQLGHVKPEHHLYRMAEGDREDELIERHAEVVHLKEDEHFYSAEDHKKGIRIIVNAREKTVHRHRLTYEQIVKLAYPTPPSENTIGYTVTFYKGHEDRHEGHLEAGESVRIHNGMIFNVTPINRS